ncbi:hypothetical protein CspHIS471_0103230 [Cutaneotrichosporon sp. HIS471]|nr:hypothetical protein CspHIS471_0103230 [Cutaneotrichosporon sp. HIS471]
MALSVPNTGREAASALCSSLSPSSPLHSDQLGLHSHSGSTALTLPSEQDHNFKRPTSFHSLHGAQEAAESLGLEPPPTSPIPPPIVSQSGSYYTASAGGGSGSGSTGYDPSIYTDAVQYDNAGEYHTSTPNFEDDQFNSDSIDYESSGNNYKSAFGSNVDPLYADDEPDVAELSGVQSTRSRASQGIRLGIGGGRSPSALSGRSSSPLRFPSNPDRPGSPMRLPRSPTPAYNLQRSPSPDIRQRLPPSPTPSGPQRLPHSPCGPQRLPSPGSQGVYQYSEREGPSSSRPTSGPSLCLPPSLSPALPHSPRAPSPLATSWEAPEPEPELDPPPVPRALPQPPETPQSMRLTRVPVSNVANSGATRRMVEAWESHAPASVTPTRQVRPLPMPQSAPGPLYPEPRDYSPSHQRISQKYLAQKENKPLPIPTATLIAASATMPWPQPATARAGPSVGTNGNPRSQRVTPNGSPIKERSPITGLSPTWLFTTQEHQGEVDSPKSPGRERISLRHPLKDIKNAFSTLRRIGHKEKDEPTGLGTASVGMHGNRPHKRLDDEWFRRPLDPPVLDRMGDDEMAEDEMHTGGVLWLPTLPDRTRHGDWMTAWASLSRTHLTLAFAPVLVGDPYGATRPNTARSDEELPMRSCTDVRPLLVAEVARLGLPPLPEQGDIIMLEFMHGARRYLAVDFPSASGWIAAINNVRHGFGTLSPSLKSYHDGSLRMGQLDEVAKFGDTWVGSTSEPRGWNTAPDNGPRMQPLQPSPVRSQDTGLSAAALESMAEEVDVPPTPPPKSRPRSMLITDRMAAFSPEIKPTLPLKLQKRMESGMTQRTQNSGPTQTQHTGTTGATVGLGSPVTGPSCDHSQPLPKDRDTPGGLRPESGMPLRMASVQLIDPLGTSMADRIRIWQPSHDTPPPEMDVSRSGSQKLTGVRDNDPCDLNPSRSASQIRPARSAMGIDLAALDAGLARPPVVKEVQFGARSPARKAVPKYIEEGKTGKEAEPLNSADSVRPPDPDPVPDVVQPVELPVESPVPVPVVQPGFPSVSQPREPPAVLNVTDELPASPRPKRLNTRIAAAMEKFEATPKPNATPKTPVVAKSPLSTTKPTSVWSPLSTSKSPKPQSKSPKPPSIVTPIHAPVARPTTSAALLESAACADISDDKSSVSAKSKDRLAPPNLAATLAPPKRPASATSVGSATSVRDRIEALSRAAASPVAATPMCLPVAATKDKGRPALQDKPLPNIDDKALPHKDGKPLTPTHSLPVAGSALSPPLSNPQSSSSLKLPQGVALSSASPAASTRLGDRSARLRDLASPSKSAPHSRRRKDPTPLLYTSSTITWRRTLTVTNPDPDCPPEQPNTQLLEAQESRRDQAVSDLSTATEPRESIAGLLAAYAEAEPQPNDKDIGQDETTLDPTTDTSEADDETKRQGEHAAEVEVCETCAACEECEAAQAAEKAEKDAARGADLDPNLGGPDPVLTTLNADHAATADQMRILTTLMNESAGQQASSAADVQQRLVALDEGVRSVHASIPPDLAEQIARIQTQLGELITGVAATTMTLNAVHASQSGGDPAEEVAKDEVGAERERSPQPEEVTDDGKAEEPIVNAVATVGTADETSEPASNQAAETTEADKAVESGPSEPAPNAIMTHLENIKDNIDFLSEQVNQLTVSQQALAAGAGTAGAQAVLAKMEQMDEAKAFGESRLVYEAEEKAKAAEKLVAEATARAEAAEKAKAEAEEAAKEKAAAVTESKDAPKDAPQDESKDSPKDESKDTPATDDKDSSEDAPKDAPAEPEAKEDPPKEPDPPPAPAVTAEQFAELMAVVSKMAEDQTAAQATALKDRAQMNEYLGNMNEYLTAVVTKQSATFDHLESRYDELSTRDAKLLESNEAMFNKYLMDSMDALQALGLDLHQSISGERLNFIEAMEKATSIRLENHTREFVDALKGEVSKAQMALTDLKSESLQVQEDTREIIEFFLKRMKKNNASKEMYPQHVQDAMDRFTAVLNQTEVAISPPPAPRPLPIPPFTLPPIPIPPQ